MSSLVTAKANDKSKMYSVHLFTKHGVQQMLACYGDDEFDALVNYATIRNMFENGWIIISENKKNPFMRRYDDDENVVAEIYIELSPYSKVR